MKGRIAGFAVLLVWGLVKLPFETEVAKTREHARLGDFKMTTDLRQRIGQAGVAAAFGGLSGAAADLAWIRAHVAWQNAEYGRMKLFFDTCIALQPRRELFYEMASWHMAWNGGAYMEQTIKDPVERQREVEKYWRLGEEYAKEGVANVPESWVLWQQLANIYKEKFHDYEKAAAAFAEATKRPGRLDYIKRFGPFMLAKVPGREREAYEQLLALYKEGEENWVQTLLSELQRLEKFLNIPEDQRQKIDPDDLLPPGAKRTHPRVKKPAAAPVPGPAPLP
jgi:hypothetical protein